jgi:hypothetical protein
MDPVISVEFASAMSCENRYSDDNNNTEIFDINAASSSDSDEDDRSDLSDIEPGRHISQIDHLKSVKKPIKCQNQRVSSHKNEQPTYDPQTCGMCSCLLLFQAHLFTFFSFFNLMCYPPHKWYICAI